mmetsp:Transcript_6468/g.26204  ORF Transcript_6468/g.26204 Transcript_6468/m.26204 type:complete len:497 (+) Transcript_6468:183-1673(+)
MITVCIVLGREPPATPLTEWLALNQSTRDAEEPPPRYIDMPKSYVWTSGKWRKQRTRTFAVGRVHWVHPTSGEAFYLRILLAREETRGAKTFEALRTVRGEVHQTYKAACAALGLLQDDAEWDGMMTEAAQTQMGKRLRALFVYILLNCQPTHADALFESHSVSTADDLSRDVRSRRRNMSDDEAARFATSLLLLEIEVMLKRHSVELTLAKMHLPELISDQDRDAAQSFREEMGAPQLIVEETYDRGDRARRTQEDLARMLDSQRAVVDPIISAVREGRQDLSFWDAPAGTGKTFCANTLLAAVRGMEDKHALAVASSGIAAVLLEGGRTFHSRFKAPLSMGRESPPFAVKLHTALADLIRRADIILWDEAPMMNRHYLEGLDAMLRDVMRSEQPFGGKRIVVAGDFRQTLPVVKRGGRAQTVRASHKESRLWRLFTTRRLEVNMRVRLNGQSQEAEDFAAMISEVGERRELGGFRRQRAPRRGDSRRDERQERV